MRTLAFIFFSLFTFFFPSTLLSQNKTLDSLKLLLKTAKDDTNEVNVLNAISKELTNTGDYERARNYAEQGKLISDRLNFRKGLADYYSAIGVVFYYQGNYSEALSSHFEALKIREDLHDKKGIASSYNNISIIYMYEHNHKEALHYLLPALQIKQELGDEKGLVSTYNNIGLAYQGLQDTAEAMKYYRLSLQISLKMKNKKGIGNAYNNIGGIFYLYKQFDSAYYYFDKGYHIREQTGYKQGMVSSLIQLGTVSVDLHHFDEAKKYYDDALALATEIGEKEDIKNAYFGLSQLNSELGNYKEAYEYFTKFKLLQDSIFTKESNDNSLRTELNYSFAKKQAAQKAEDERKQAELRAETKRQELYVYFVSGILGLVVIFALFMYRSIVQKKNANRELDLRNKKIELAYSIIEQKNKEITDSINYAQRIQNAILPEKAEIISALPQSFVLYQPKDIVGGDFYYFNRNGNEMFLAVADCTGHGVPGAFMSLIGSKELSIANHSENKPGKILERLNVSLKRTLKQHHMDATRDGMDIAMLRINGKSVNFAGANRPLWILRNGAIEMEEIKPTKAAIAGFTSDDQVFEEHTITMNAGDTLFIFTDGYSDQFGKEQKKLGTKKFRSKLIDSGKLEMGKMHTDLDKFFRDWKGETEQLDDILLIGVRF